MLRTPLCGTVEGTTGEVFTIFIGSDSCCLSVVLTNTGTNAVNVLINGSTVPFATILPGSRLALALQAVTVLQLQFTGPSTVFYSGCACCDCNCCNASCNAGSEASCERV